MKKIILLLICLMLNSVFIIKSECSAEIISPEHSVITSEFFMTTLFLETKDNERISVNHYNKNRKEVLIIAPGWCMGKDTKPFKLMSQDFFKYMDVMSFDFRGHGKSSGCFTFSAKEAEDVKTVVDYAKSRYSKIYLIGFSLGGSSSIIYAANNGGNVAKLIIVSAPCDFKRIENHFFSPNAFLPTFKKLELENILKVRPGNPFCKKIKPIEQVENISVPIFFIAGGKDPTVHKWHEMALFNETKSPKKLKIYEKGLHAEDLYIEYPEIFITTCVQWLNEQ